MDQSLEIFVTIVFVLLAIGATLFLIMRTRNARAEAMISRSVEGFCSPKQFDDMMKIRIKNRSRNRHLFCLQLRDGENIVRAFGMEQYAKIITELMQRLEKIFYNQCVICHYEEDAIWMLSNKHMNSDQMEAVCGQIVYEITQPLILSDALKLNIDINLAVCSVDYAHSIKELFGDIQLAMTSAKHKGINNYEIYHPELSNVESKEYKLYLEIKEAIKNKEFTLFFQPVIDVNSREIVAFENFMRWKKDGAFLTPEKFMNIIEESGAIIDMTDWAIDESLARQKEWAKLSGIFDLMSSINLSPKQIVHPQIVEIIRTVVKRRTVNPDTVIFELDNWEVIENSPVAKANIEILQKLGFKIALDNYDYRTANYNVIMDRNLYALKLDRNAINDGQKDPFVVDILKVLSKFALSQKIEIIVKGIENEEHIKLAKELHFMQLQGYYIGKPILGQDVTACFEQGTDISIFQNFKVASASEEKLNSVVNLKNSTLESQNENLTSNASSPAVDQPQSFEKPEQPTKVAKVEENSPKSVESQEEKPKANNVQEKPKTVADEPINQPVKDDKKEAQNNDKTPQKTVNVPPKEVAKAKPQMPSAKPTKKPAMPLPGKKPVMPKPKN